MGNNGFGGVENSVVKHGDPQTHLFQVKVTLRRRRRSAEGNALSLLIPPRTGWEEGREGGNLVKAAHKGIHSRERERMLAPKHNSGESQVPTILDEKGFSRPWIL